MVAMQEQMQFGEQYLDNQDLLQLLTTRQGVRDEYLEVSADYREAALAVKDAILALDLPDGDYRCGPFKITLARREPRDVAFTTAPGKRIQIKLLE